ncbi:hypothetical protein Lsha_2827 [Legionella shakespearei DSM 23087]|uniref:Uncharacterized protein n=1 Tax=Legionella shakespearei DSM 23087 TaxID=1122169 RepID=A0A0W0YHN5_9GAMM|nr:hypothetical protein Lsha_2827 [Legionella shakespearei DSM 23087]
MDIKGISKQSAANFLSLKLRNNKAHNPATAALKMNKEPLIRANKPNGAHIIVINKMDGLGFIPSPELSALQQFRPASTG